MSDHKKIVVTKNGPYLVSGSTPLALLVIGVDEKGLSTQWVEGESFPAAESFALCRCGSSKNKPFCDGTHQKIGFEGAETASHETVMDQAEVMEGPVMQLADAEVLCAYARFCDPNGRIWNQVGHTDNPRVRGHFIKQAGDCPAGRLLAIDKASGTVVEPKLPKSIGIVEDPANGCSGPLWVRGGIEMTGADGKPYEVATAPLYAVAEGPRTSPSAMAPTRPTPSSRMVSIHQRIDLSGKTLVLASITTELPPPSLGQIAGLQESCSSRKR